MPASESAPRALYALARQTLSEWLDDNAPTWAASLAYYTVFSLAPTLIIALAIAGAVFGEDAARGAVQAQLEGIIGVTTAATVQAAMVSASREGSGGFATAVGVLLMVFAATGVFSQLQGALNTIWKVKPAATTVLAFLRTRFLSLAVVMGIGFLLLVSLVVSAATSALCGYVGGALGGWKVLMQVVNLVVGAVASSLLFAMMFKLLPDLKVRWRDVWLGAAVSAVLFTLGKSLIALYLATAATESSYGAAGSLAALLVWVYYSSMTTLFGAELAQVYARRHGSLRGASPGPSSDASAGAHAEDRLAVAQRVQRGPA
jgi:membrane protein